MFNFILAMTGGTSEGGNSTGNWIMLAVLGVLMVGMILMSIIPQRKRQKQAQEMMSALKKGDKIKTIGGFVGTIVGVDNGNNTLDIDVSAKGDGTVIVTIDKSAVYTVMNAVPQENLDESKTVDTSEGQDVVTADDMEEDRKTEERKAKKKKKGEVAETSEESTPSAEPTGEEVFAEATEVAENTESGEESDK